MLEERIDAAAWRTPLVGGLALVVLGLIAYVYYPLFFPPSTRDLAIESEEFFFEANEAAGAPVLVLAAWLFYRRSHYLDVLRGPGAPVAGGVVLLGTAALFGWGHYTAAADLRLASVIGLLFGAALCLGGGRAARAFWLPIVFLAFALPLPPVPLSAAMFPIQLVTAEFAGGFLNLIGVKSLVSGDQILRPENTFIVIETCSGVRTIVTLSMLTVLLIDLFERRGWHAFLLFALAPVVAFVTNGFRVVTLVLNPHSSIHSIHNLQGIVMLLVGLTVMYGLDVVLERLLGSRPPEAEGRAPDPVAQAAPDADPGRLPVRLGVVLVALVAMVSIQTSVSPWRGSGGLDEMPDDVLVRVFGEGASRVVPPDFQFRGSLRYLAHADRVVRFEGEPLEVFLGIGNESLRSHTLLSKRLAWPGSGWIPVEESRVELAPDAPDARRMLLRRSGRTTLSYSWYPRAGGFFEEWWRQAAALDRSPWRREEHMLAIRLATPVGRGEQALERAEARIRRAWAKLAPALDGYAPMNAN